MLVNGDLIVSGILRPVSGVFRTTEAGNVLVGLRNTENASLAAGAGSGVLHVSTNFGVVPTLSNGTVLVAQRNLSETDSMSVQLLAGNNATLDINFGDRDDANVGLIRYSHANNFMAFSANDAETMRITTARRVLIGTTSEAALDTASAGSGVLHVASNFGVVPTLDNAATLIAQRNLSETDDMSVNFIAGNAGGVFLNFGDRNSATIGRISYSHSTNALSFNTNSVTAMTISSSGQITKPTQSTFHVNNTSARTDVTGDGTVYTVPFNATVFDQANNYNTATSLFTAPVAGNYYFAASLELTNLTTDVHLVELHVITTNRTYKSGGILVNGASIYPSISVIGDMSLGHTAKLAVAVFNGAKIVDVSSDGTKTWFCGTLLS
ncbi:hypothetical protein HY496_02635 [Candidatus Woesearchaeota archaeon]|nr:hypothetical protein [Candidatus Woesearchaeota archaeon]